MDVFKSTHDLIEPQDGNSSLLVKEPATLSSSPDIKIQFGSFGYQKKPEETVTESVARSERGSGLVIQFGSFGCQKKAKETVTKSVTRSERGSGLAIQFGSFGCQKKAKETVTKKVTRSKDGYQKKAKETVTESVTRSKDGSGLVVKEASDIKIQFGTFGSNHHKRTPIENTITGNTTSVVKAEVEPQCTGNINITETILSILQEKKGEKVMMTCEEKLADDQTKEKVAAGENVQMMKTEESTEKVQTSADKEALRKEKARLKRLRKKERKRAAGDAANSSRASGGDVAESKENRNEELQQALQPCFWSKQVKPETILWPGAMAVAIQNKRQWRLWANVGIAVVLILSIFSLH